MPNPMGQYQELFVSETLEHTQALGDALLRLERGPGDPNLVAEIFRSAHTIKGMAAAMGLQPIADLAHAMENLLDDVRKGQAPVTGPMIDVLLRCVDALEAMVRGEAVEGEGLLRQLQALKVTASSAPPPAPGPSPTAPTPTPPAPSPAAPAAVHPLPQALPPTPPSTPHGWRVELRSGAPGFSRSKVEEILRKVGLVGDVSSVTPASEAMGNAPSPTLTFDLRGPANAAEAQSILATIQGIALVDLHAQGEAAAPSPSRANIPDPRAQGLTTVKVDIHKLDDLMNTVGEMVIGKLRLMEIARSQGLRDLEEVAMGLDRLTRDLQDLVLGIRLVPLGNIFDKFPRLIRDLSHRLDKDADLEVVGSEIELDRTIISEIDEPLVHLLRNAVDHGIEGPNERSAAGKDPQGRVKLRARREQSWVYIEVEDDGRGMDPERLRTKAVERGFLSREEAAALDRQGALNLIYLPGFSMKAEVTEVSGRGVGMDVVRTKVQGIGGSVSLETTTGKGTKVTLRLPLSVAIIQALLVSAEGETYALPMDSVLETLNLESTPVAFIGGAPVATLRNGILPLANLADLLKGRREKLTGGYVVVVEKGPRRYGLVVESILGQQSIVTKGLDKELKRTRGLAGATILGDGSISLILDVGTLPKG